MRQLTFFGSSKKNYLENDKLFLFKAQTLSQFLRIKKKLGTKEYLKH